jgi:4-carboxymuconolactone decarboxylase
MNQSRYEIGLKNFKEIYGDLGSGVIKNLNHISSDIAKYIIEFAFGEIYERKGLDLKSREIVAISSLLTMGNATPQLKSHIHGALNIGCSREQIVEIIIQICLYAGFPSAINGLNVMNEVFSERDAKNIFP